MDIEQSSFKLERLDDDIPKDHLSRFIVRFVDEFFPVLEVEENMGGKGRPVLPVREMFKLIIYAFNEGVTSSKVIEDHAKYHKIYLYVSNGIKPSQRSIRRFIRDYGYLFNVFIGSTLLFANELGITDFKHISIDGTIKKAYNSKFNVLHEKDINTLIQYYSGLKLPNKKIKKLPRPARKLIERTDLNNEDKLELLFELQTQLKMSGQNTVPVNDVEARWMHNKQGLNEVAYNVESAVGTVSKLICAVKVSQKPTDHYELPEIVKNAINNINDEPEYVSADTGYHTETSFQYLEKNNIKGLIPDRKQTRENTGRLSENPFHKDHFKHDLEKDTYICPNNQELPFQQEIKHYLENETKPYKIERRYWNYNACQDCQDKEKCYKGTQRQITEFTSNTALKMKKQMETKEYKTMFKKRSSTVEAPFGTLKTYYHINELPTTGIQHTEHILALQALTYNLKRLNHIIKNEYDETDNINQFIEKIGATLNLKCKTTEK